MGRNKYRPSLRSGNQMGKKMGASPQMGEVGVGSGNGFERREKPKWVEINIVQPSDRKKRWEQALRWERWEWEVGMGLKEEINIVRPSDR